jgi:hypothetical protein
MLPQAYDQSHKLFTYGEIVLLVFWFVAPLAAGALVAFAAKVDPKTGHWRSSRR